MTHQLSLNDDAILFSSQSHPVPPVCPSCIPVFPDEIVVFAFHLLFVCSCVHSLYLVEIGYFCRFVPKTALGVQFLATCKPPNITILASPRTFFATSNFLYCLQKISILYALLFQLYLLPLQKSNVLKAMFYAWEKLKITLKIRS